MQAIAKPDGRDMSVSDIPFNWNAQLDVRKLRVGIIKESFDELTNADAKRNAQQLLDDAEVARRLDTRPADVPAFNTNVAALGVESAVFFDHMTRAGQHDRGARRQSQELRG